MQKILLSLSIGSIFIAPSLLAVDLIGKTISNDPVNIVSEVSGVIQNADLDVGQIVNQGETLATVKADDFKLELSKKKAHLALAQADLKLKHSVYQRYQELRKKNSLSQNELDIAAADYASAKANLSLAQLDVANSREDLKQTTIKTLLGGFVSQRHVENGTWVNQGDPLYRIVNIDTLTVRLLASEFDLADLAVGQTIELWSESTPTQRITANISRIGVEPDANSLAYPVEIDIDNQDHSLKPGMSIHATTQLSSVSQ